MKTWITQLRKGLLEFCVCNAMAAGEVYGYQLVQRLKGLDGLALTESTVYPILNRLRQDGLVRFREEPSSSGPPRRYLTLTPAGRGRLARMNAYWASLSRSIAALRTGPAKENSK